MLEEKRKKAEEEDMFDDIGAEAGQVMMIVCPPNSFEHDVHWGRSRLRTC